MQNVSELIYLGWIENTQLLCECVAYDVLSVCICVFVHGLCRYKNRSVLSYHYYCWLIAPERVYEHYKLWDRVVCDDVLGPLVMRLFIFTCVMYAIRGWDYAMSLCFVCLSQVSIYQYWTNWTIFRHRSYLWLILHFVWRVCRYLQKYGYFPMSLSGTLDLEKNSPWPGDRVAMTKFFAGVCNLFDRRLLPVYYSKHLPLSTTLWVQPQCKQVLKVIWEERVAHAQLFNFNKVPTGSSGTPQIHPQNCSFPFDDYHPI